MLHRIRPEQPDDTPALRTEICRRCWHASYGQLLSAATIDATFDGTAPLTGSWLDRRTKLIERSYAEADGETVGFIEIGELSRPRSGEVIALYVLPEFARRGFGRSLWERGCHTLSGLGYETVEVWAVRDAEAPRFYEAMGCTAVATGMMGIGGDELAVTGFSYGVTPIRKD